MSRSRTHATKKKTNGRAMLFGVCLTVIMLFAMSMLGAVIAARMENPTSIIGIASTASLYLTAAISSFVISKYKGEGGVLPATVCAIAFSLILLVISAIVNSGHIPAITAINLGAYIIIAFIFALIGQRRTKRRIRR